MEDLLVVHVFDGETDLSEPIKYLVFGKVVQFTLRVASELILRFYFALKVATVAVVHDDAQLALFGFVNLTEARNVGVVQHFENFGFLESLFPFFLAHLTDVNLLNDGHLLV